MVLYRLLFKINKHFNRKYKKSKTKNPSKPHHKYSNNQEPKSLMTVSLNPIRKYNYLIQQ